MERTWQAAARGLEERAGLMGKEMERPKLGAIAAASFGALVFASYLDL